MSDGGDKLAELEARLAKLADRVRSELPERATALREAAEALSADEATARADVQRLAHMIRGTAGSHGMTRLTEPAAQVETSARSMALGDLVPLVRSLADALDRTAREKSIPPPPVMVGPTAPTAPLQKPLAGRRVLAIDDDAPTRRLLTMTLSNLGGATALVEELPLAFFGALEREHYDVVIVDAMMPDVNGLACLEKIAGSPMARPGACYFVLSAATAEELSWSLPSSLKVGWLRKPFRPRELLDAIQGALAT